MITIVNAWLQRGWDSCDHLLNDATVSGAVGRSYRTLAHARRSVDALAPRDYVAIEYVGPDGLRYVDATRATGGGISRSPVCVGEIEVQS